MRSASKVSTPNDSLHLFARNLTRLRRQGGHSIKTAAAELGVGPSTWSQWESAKRYPSPRLFDCIAALFRVPTCMLIATCPPPCQSNRGRIRHEPAAVAFTECDEIVLDAEPDETPVSRSTGFVAKETGRNP